MNTPSFRALSAWAGAVLLMAASGAMATRLGLSGVPVTAETVALLRAKPVYVDIDPRTYNLDPALLEAAITPRTKAIVPVHLYGQAADMNAIMEIATKHQLFQLTH